MDMILLNEINKLQSGGSGSDAASPLIGKKDPTRFTEPSFAVVTIHSDNYWGATTYDHNMAPIGRKYYNNSGYGSSGTNSTYGGDMSSDYYNYARSDNTTSSSNDRGNRSCNASHCGGIELDIGRNGDMNFHHGGQPAGEAAKRVGTWLHNSTPHLALFMYQDRCYVGNRNGTSGQYQQSSHGTYGYQGFWGQRGMNSTAREGGISYNEKTKRLAMMESNGGQMRCHVWKDVESPATFKTNAEFFGTSNLNDSTKMVSQWFNGNYNNGEGARRSCITLCDNHTITIQKFGESQGNECHKITSDGNSYGSWVNTHNFGCTTSYGTDQGARYGQRFQISNDGKYVFQWGYYYYYGCGMHATITRVLDGKMLHWENNNSSDGIQSVPIGDSDFMLNYSSNQDGSGMRMTRLAIEELFERHGEGSTISPTWQYYFFDNHYYSTQYAYILPVMNTDWSKFVDYDKKFALAAAE